MQRTVIDEDLIIQCIKKSRQSSLDAANDEGNNGSFGANKNQNSAQALAESEEPIDFNKLTELSLSFRDIYKIDHLKVCNI